MQCPYCASSLHKDALVCAHCTRDLYLLKPLQERVEALQAELAARAKLDAAPYEQRIAVLEQEVAQLRSDNTGVRPAGQPVTGSKARSYAVSALIALTLSAVLLIAAHGLMLFVYDLKPLYLRIASVLIPIPFGFALLVWHPRRIVYSAVAGFLMAFLAVYLMLLTTARIDNVPVLPQDARDVREVLEYVVSIGLAFLTGLLLGKIRYHRMDIAPQPNRAVVFLAQLFATDASGEFGFVRLSGKIQKMINAVMPLVTAGASIYAGIKALLGDGG